MVLLLRELSMALTKVDTTQTDKNYLETFLNVKDSVLSTYNSNIDNIHFVAPGWEGRSPQPEIKGWRMCHLFSTEDSLSAQITGSNTRQTNINLFSQIQALLSGIPSHVHVVGSGIMEAFPGIEESWHAEQHPIEQGFKRYHIPLTSPAGYSLGVRIGEDVQQYNWEEGFVFEFNPSEIHQVMHSGSGTESRLVWIIDVIENSELTGEELTEAMMRCWMVGAKGVMWDKQPIIE